MRRPGVLTSLVALIAFCALIGLGVWQVQRLKWKTELLRRIDALQAAAPQPMERAAGQLRAGADVDFTRVILACNDVETRPALRLHAVLAGQSGYRLITACPLDGGRPHSILVDRGFVALDEGEAAHGVPGGPITRPVVGVLRAPDRPNFVTPRNEPAKNLWYWRDIPAMAQALGAPDPAPAFLMLESPAPTSGLPRPAALPAAIPNNHLGYAITWFGLAAALAGVYLAMLFAKRAG